MQLQKDGADGSVGHHFAHLASELGFGETFSLSSMSWIVICFSSVVQGSYSLNGFLPGLPFGAAGCYGNRLLKGSELAASWKTALIVSSDGLYTRQDLRCLVSVSGIW